jgi:hypothetical protein
VDKAHVSPTLRRDLAVTCTRVAFVAFLTTQFYLGREGAGVFANTKTAKRRLIRAKMVAHGGSRWHIGNERV